MGGAFFEPLGGIGTWLRRPLPLARLGVVLARAVVVVVCRCRPPAGSAGDRMVRVEAHTLVEAASQLWLPECLVVGAQHVVNNAATQRVQAALNVAIQVITKLSFKSCSSLECRASETAESSGSVCVPLDQEPRLAGVGGLGAAAAAVAGGG